MAQVLTLDRCTGPARFTAKGRRGYNGLRLADCRLTIGGGGGGGSLTRTSSGILFYDDFARSDRALNGDNGWVDDAGTWSIVSQQATSSGGNFDRCRNTGMTPVAGAVWEARAKAPSSGIYHMFRLLVPSSSDDYHFDMQGNNGDKRLATGASTDTTLASGLTLTMDATSFHVIKALYQATRQFVVWWDHSATEALGNLGTPFTAGSGPTAAGVVGMMGYGGAPLFDWVLVSSDHLLAVGGLTTGQGFQLLDASDVVIGSSGAETAGTATLDIATLVDGLTTGYLQVYNDQGTWADPVSGARYPAVSGNATDLCGGDIYLSA